MAIPSTTHSPALASLAATAALAVTGATCGHPVEHVPELWPCAWARCELPPGHPGLHQLTLRWAQR